MTTMQIVGAASCGEVNWHGIDWAKVSSGCVSSKAATRLLSKGRREPADISAL
jgi:hypothetical protein